MDYEFKDFETGHELQSHRGNTPSNRRAHHVEVCFLYFLSVVLLLCVRAHCVVVTIVHVRCYVLFYSISRELVACFNKITMLPPQIGKLKRLRRLILNTNKLKHIPDDIGQLDMLEELVLSENSIEDIPVSLSLMSNLKILKLANNKLKAIPYEIADILTLEEIDCSNNHNLEAVPAKWRGDTDSVLFTCRVHRGMMFYKQSCRNHVGSIKYRYGVMI